jgi:hypothetical protein
MSQSNPARTDEAAALSAGWRIPMPDTLFSPRSRDLVGLWYPILIPAMTFLIGLIFIPGTRDVDITNVQRTGRGTLGGRFVVSQCGP